MGIKVKLSDLVIDDRLKVRDGLNPDAVARYRQLLEAGKTKAIIVQRGTLRVIDGHHRLQAVSESKIEEVWVEEKDVADKDLLAAVFSANKAHGVPLSTQERNRLIARLYLESGWTQAQISELVGLTQQGVAYILAAVGNTGTGEIGQADKRVKLRDDQMPAVARLILAGASHQEVAERFGVSRSTVTDRWAQLRDQVKTAYEGGALKKDVAEQVGLTADEVDAILRQYDPEPLNFTPQTGSLWAGFAIDPRFGTKGFPGSIPAALVRNLLYFFSRPGDIILDPAAGGGTVLDVCRDMVGRRCYAYDLAPVREDVSQHDLLQGPPPCPEPADVVFFDPPYSIIAEGKYQRHGSQLGDLAVPQFLQAMEQVFGYRDRGTVVLLMGSLRRGGEFVPLPHRCAALMEQAGWQIVDWIVNEVHRPSGETAVSIAQHRKSRLPMRNHIDVIVGRKP